MRFVGNMFLFGMKFGTLTVIDEGRRLHHEQRWKCRCDCGHEFLVLTRGLLSEKVVTCPKCAKKILRALDPYLSEYYNHVYTEVLQVVSRGLNFTIPEFKIWSSYKQATIESILIVKWLSQLDLRDCTWRLRDAIDDHIDPIRHWQADHERKKYLSVQICNQYGYDFDWIWYQLSTCYGWKYAGEQFDILREIENKEDFLEWLQHCAEEAQLNIYMSHYFNQYPEEWNPNDNMMS